MDLTSSTLEFWPRSLTVVDGVEFGLARTMSNDRLAVLADSPIPEFEGERSELGGRALVLCPLNATNAAALRSRLDWLRPRPLGLATSFGMGDRLGLATPGQVRAVRSVGGKIAPVFIQQSIREMTRTNRSPQQVADDATWGIFAEGWQGIHGADADHLKTPADIDACLAAGYTFFTIDPGDYVDNRAGTAMLDELRELTARLPKEVSVKASGLLGRHFETECLAIAFEEATLLKAAAKYGKAVAHVAGMYRHLVQAAGPRPFEMEVSVDETDQPTSHAEHVYIASELKRLGVRWVSLTPRYVGGFEKAIDYRGDLNALRVDFVGHASIAARLGPYKLGLHSGSDKYAVYPLLREATRGLCHVKTAGTSLLEGLRVTAEANPKLFREIASLALERFAEDRLTYHLSTNLAGIPDLKDLDDAALQSLLDQDDSRQVLHVAFGSILDRFGDRVRSCLSMHLEGYHQVLAAHFARHLGALC